jgi:hypothetical protein
MTLDEIKRLDALNERTNARVYRFAKLVLGILIACICAFFLFSCGDVDTHYKRVAIKDIKTKQYSDISVHIMHKVGDTVLYNNRFIGQTEVHDCAIVVKEY